VIGSCRPEARLGIVGLVAAAWAIAAQAATDAPDAPAPGLAATLRREGEPADAVHRVDPRPSHDWGDAPPDPRLGPGGFHARWDGWLLVQSPGPHRFRVEADGEARLVLGDEAAREIPGARASEPVDLPAGFVRFRLDYRHARGPARLAVGWEGPGFGPEPLPARVLFHDPEASPPDPFEAGRRLADRLGCANCHRVLDSPPHPDLGPPLAEAGRSIDPGWLLAWLRDPHALRPTAAMPSLGDAGLAPADAADLAAFLRQNARPPGEPTAELTMALNVADPALGRRLFRASGCLACHARRDDGPGAPEPPRDAVDLTDVGRKRDARWLARFLARSGKDGPSPHRPDLRLDPDPAAHLAAYLDGPGGPPAEGAGAPAVGDAGRGRRLAERARCAACHAIPGLDPTAPDLPLGPGSDPSAGCLADRGRAPLVPRFALTDEERTALRAFVAGLPGRPSPAPAETRAEDDLRRRRCLNCHARDGQGGSVLGVRLAAYLAEDPELGALKGRLTPPDLTAVGAKLRPEYLAQAVRGEAPVARPWLAVRMPRFAFEPGEAERLAAYFRGRDGAAGEGRSEPRPPDAPPDRERAAALIGQRGFGCVSCHVVGGRMPPGGEPETMGPDLALADRRLPYDYFRRWLADPQRILPGTPMPQFVQPVPGQPGELGEQLDVLWSALGDDPVALVGAGVATQVRRPGKDRAEVVHDMVVLDESVPIESRYVPRAVAIGLPNGRSLLFDADRLAWVAAWRGGFLTRTKSGRLWEWRPDAPIDWRPDDRPPPVAWIGPDGERVGPRPERDRFGRFRGLTFEGPGVSIAYDLRTPGGSWCHVVERLAPVGVEGWTRDVSVSGVPAGMTPVVGPPGPSSTVATDEDGDGTFRARIEADGRGPGAGPQG
jgi:mono/diheme cytochrome c family protein